MMGTTSACAENTHPGDWGRRYSWNYLRVRGEYKAASFACIMAVELPPRARRIPGAEHPVEIGMGTTSACAENTIHPIQALLQRGNYLRVRGEYTTGITPVIVCSELPPRARRIQ